MPSDARAAAKPSGSQHERSRQRPRRRGGACVRRQRVASRRRSRRRRPRGRPGRRVRFNSTTRCALRGEALSRCRARWRSASSGSTCDAAPTITMFSARGDAGLAREPLGVDEHGARHAPDRREHLLDRRVVGDVHDGVDRGDDRAVGREVVEVAQALERLHAEDQVGAAARDEVAGDRLVGRGAGGTARRRRAAPCRAPRTA